MGLLDAIFSSGDSAKRRIRGLLADPVGSLEQTAGMLSDDRKLAAERNARMISDPATVSSADVQSLLGGGASFAPMGLTVWHGSPHKFDKFDMSKIGTGEGAQAYGHGLYVAESPGVADSYRVKLTPQSGGKAVSNAETEQEWYKLFYDKYKGKVQDSIGITYPHPDAVLTAMQHGRTDGIPKDLINALKSRLDPGALYKVDIPDEAVARFLDWDKKLSEQIPEVQAVAKQWNNGTLPSGISSGDELLRYIQQQLGFIGSPKKAEQILKEAGVPGIKYLDGGSRSAGQGSRNYVLFDDQLPRILEVNGQATGQTAWKPNEWQGLLGGGQ